MRDMSFSAVLDVFDLVRFEFIFSACFQIVCILVLLIVPAALTFCFYT